MAEQLYFARHTKVYLEQGANIWEIPVMDGFSFSQSTNASEVVLAEMESTSGVSRRGRTTFNDSYAPAEWSFSTYVRPFQATPGTQGSGTGVWEATGSITAGHAVEEALWANFVAVNAWNATADAGTIATLGAVTSTATDREEGVYVIETVDYTTSGGGSGAVFKVTIDATGQDSAAVVELQAVGNGFAAAETITVPATKVGGTGDFVFSVGSVETKSYWDKGIVPTATNTTINFSSSNRSTLGTFNLLFEIGSCSGDAPTIYKISDCVANSVGIDFDIDGIAMTNWSGFGSIITDEGTTPVVPTIYEGVVSTSNFIRNRLTTLGITAADTTTFPGENSNGVYNVVLTGGSLSFENNITFLTPETLCKVDQPIGHVTGARNFGGTFTCYVNTDTGSSHDLWEDLISATTTVTNSFALTFGIGGTTATPRMEVAFPQANLEIPAHSIEDVISLEVNFSGLPTDIDDADEATITFTG